MSLEGIFPDVTQASKLQRAGWSLVARTGEMGAVRRDGTGGVVPWSEAWRQLQAERTEAKKARR